MLRALKSCLFLIFFVSAVAQTSSDAIDPIKDLEFAKKMLNDEIHDLEAGVNHDLAEKCKELFVDVAQIELLEFFIFPIAIIAHELGHATAAKTLFDVRNPIQIHIGTRTPESTPRLFSLGNMHFYKRIPWRRGLTDYGDNVYIKQNHIAYRYIYSGIRTAAGGMSAASLMYFLLSAITGYCAYCDNKKLSEITLKSFINGAGPFTYIVNTKNLSYKQKRFLINATFVISLTLISHLFYGCTPYRGGDGVRIWKEYMGVTGTSLKIVHVLSILGAWGCWALLIKKYCDARKKLSPELSKISVPVALASLFLMYNQLIPEL